MKLSIVGAGMGQEDFLTAYGKKKIENADIVLSTKRLAQNLDCDKIHLLSIGEIVDFVGLNAEKYENVVVLASGDVGFFSIAKTIARKLPHMDIEYVSGISSLQYFTAMIKKSYDNVTLVSLHGREKSILPFVSYNPRVFALTGGKYKAGDIIGELCHSGLGNVMIHVGENLGDDAQRIVCGTALELSQLVFQDLSVMYIENPNFADRFHTILDHEFIRGKSPMTKQAIRTLSVASLDIQPWENCVDIGSGTGSVTIEMGKKAYEGLVFALEKNELARQTLGENMEKFGAHNIISISALAPEKIDTLPKIDKAFIGGSSGNLGEIMDALRHNNPKMKFVINAITLETLYESIGYMKDHDFQYRLSQVSVSVGEKLGKYNMLKPENPIYIIVGEANEQ